MRNARSLARRYGMGRQVRMQPLVLAVVCAVMMTAQSAHAGLCQFDSIPNLTSVTYGTSPWTTFCGHTISGSGSGGCTATVPSGSGTVGNIGSADCLTLGSGVTLELSDITINCTGTNCGNAIVNTNSGGSSAAVTIKNGNVTGCWTTGLVFTGGSNSTVSGIALDGHTTAGACTRGLNAGINGARGTVSRVSITGWLSCILLYPGEDVNDSSMSDCYVGV